MADKPELDQLRASSEKPSWWTRTSQSVVGTLKGRTSVTLILALAIVSAIAVGVWLVV